jgi:carbamoyl-phosphate synthase large subunit
MEIVYDDVALARVMTDLTSAHGSLAREGGVSQSRPILLDRFLEDAIEVDVDAVRDATGDLYVAGIMEHVEEAGVHSGDSACILPAQTLGEETVATMVANVTAIAERLGVVGLINVQFAIHEDNVYVLEANPRASRTVPFVAKATGVSVAQVATRVMMGHTLAELRASGHVPESTPRPDLVHVKEAVLPFNRFPTVDTLLGPEMRSTGEVMGSGESFGIAFAKAQLAAGTRLPDQGTVFFSLADSDKAAGVVIAEELRTLGFAIAATAGTAAYLATNGVSVDHVVDKIADGTGTTATDLIAEGHVQMIINTPSGNSARRDGQAIRTAATVHKVPCITTLRAATAAVTGIAETRAHGWRVQSLQEMHR